MNRMKIQCSKNAETCYNGAIHKNGRGGAGNTVTHPSAQGGRTHMCDTPDSTTTQFKPPFRLEAYQYERGWVFVEPMPTLVHALTIVCINAYAVDCGHRVIDADGQIIASGSYVQLVRRKHEILYPNLIDLGA